MAGTEKDTAAGRLGTEDDLDGGAFIHVLAHPDRGQNMPPPVRNEPE